LTKGLSAEEKAMIETVFHEAENKAQEHSAKMAAINGGQ
jgi:hypothetical protein